MPCTVHAAVGRLGSLLRWDSWPPALQAAVHAIYPAIIVYQSAQRLKPTDGLEEASMSSMVKDQYGQCPASAPAPPQGVPGGSGQLGTPRLREAGPLGAQPLPRILERAASRAADLTAVDPSPGMRARRFQGLLAAACLAATWHGSKRQQVKD